MRRFIRTGTGARARIAKSVAAWIAAILLSMPSSGWASQITESSGTAEKTSSVAPAESLGRGTVGQAISLDSVVIAGSEVEVAPIDDGTDVVIRIRKVWPHGTDRRYDLDVQGRIAGVHDLTKYLRRRDGSPLEVPAIPFEVVALIDEGAVEPHVSPQTKLEKVGGYRQWAIGLSVAWVIAGIALIVWIFRRPPVAADSQGARRSLAEQLQESIDRALAGSRERRDWARLESLLLAHWRQKLGLEGVSSAEALRRLRQDEQAGRLLRKLDEALHAPDSKESIEWSELLEPYRLAESVTAARLAAEERAG